MKINNIATIVDLAFNLSGSLAGIPVILPQLPVGERVGFDTLPDVWEDIDDIGQTWTPDLDGVEVDITVEAYNPTAIQKAPYSTDMKCIDVATGWGNSLLEALTDPTWVRLDSLKSGDRIENSSLRVFSAPTDVMYVPSGVSERPTTTVAFPLYELTSSGISLEFFYSATRFGLRINDSADPNNRTYIRYTLGDYELLDDDTTKVTAIPAKGSIWELTDYSIGSKVSQEIFTNADNLELPIPFNLEIILPDSGFSMLQPANYNAWSFGEGIFVKLTN